MQNLRPFTFNEKLALGLLILFFPVNVLAPVALLAGNVPTGQEFAAGLLWRVGWLLLFFIASCAAIATIFFRADYHPSALRMHLGRILPLAALIVAMLLSSVFEDTQIRRFAKSHSEQLAGQPPRAVIYREGIPDGGVAIVRSPGFNPEVFTQGVMVELTGERIKSCKRISDSDWSCHFD